MSLKQITACIAIGISLASTACFPQATGNTQQQIQQHSQKLQEYLREKKPELAIPELQALAALDPNDVNTRANLGVLLFFKGDYANAAPQLRAAIKLQPDLWRMQALLGICEKREGDLANARTDLESSFPQLTEEKMRVQTGLEMVELYSSTGDLAKASAIIAVLREHDPTNLTILYAAYRIYSDLAGDAMLSISLTDPHSAQMHQVMAHELERQGDKVGAIAQYREALKINPALPGLHFELAEVLNATGQVANKDEAEREYRAALVVNSSDEKTECRLGDIASLRGDIEESFKHYEHAYQLQPLDPDAAIGLAKAYASLDQPQKGVPLLEQVIQQDPTNSMAHFRLSTLYRQAGRTEDAKQQIVEYKKYKEMKERLGDLYKQMRLQPGKDQNVDADEPK
ncbi:tetratricopeptide repeat protein [Acidicapsa ligni]|uniref:tetratricopeptide repeat protein n=1 Tax=Acidicapsa ligni TaxID=542300 RepID=UPI0021DF940F|nr:tetratricopeptide repeat protein [Acidicapsa ligni]